MVFTHPSVPICKNIMDLLDVFCPDMATDEILKLSPKHNLFELIAKNIKIKKYCFPSVIYRLIHRNATYFKNKCSKAAGEANECNNLLLQIMLFLKNNDLQQNALNVSYRSQNSIYSNLCLFLKKKNSFKNRRQLYDVWRQFIKGNITSDGENNASVYAQQNYTLTPLSLKSDKCYTPVIESDKCKKNIREYYYLHTKSNYQCFGHMEVISYFFTGICKIYSFRYT